MHSNRTLIWRSPSNSANVSVQTQQIPKTLRENSSFLTIFLFLQRLSRRVSKPSNTLALGKVLNKFKLSAYVDGFHEVAGEAQAFLENTVEVGCALPPSGRMI